MKIRAKNNVLKVYGEKRMNRRESLILRLVFQKPQNFQKYDVLQFCLLNVKEGHSILTEKLQGGNLDSV